MVIPLVNTSHLPTLLQGRLENGIGMLVAGVLCCLRPSLLGCPHPEQISWAPLHWRLR